MIRLEDLKRDIPEVCEKYQIAYVDAFGSLARNEATEQSDLDLVIEFAEPRNVGLSKRFFGFLHELEDRYQTKVDVVTEASLSNPVLKKSINRDRVRLYG